MSTASSTEIPLNPQSNISSRIGLELPQMCKILSVSISADKSSNAGCANSLKSLGSNNSGEDVGSATAITSTPDSLKA